METYTNPRRIPYAPTETADLYPESDGKPMADTDLHISAIIRMRQLLKGHLAKRPDDYASGNIMMYDIEGPDRTAVSPDVFVSFGVGQKPRRTYKSWEEGKPPDFVMEFSSKGTFQTDLGRKVSIYASMGIPEYFLYDVDRRYLPVPLMGFRLVDKDKEAKRVYAEIPMDADGGLFSEVLGLSFHLLDEGLGVYDVAAGQWLKTPEEAALARAEQAEQRTEQAEQRIEIETAARQREAEARQREVAARQEAEAETARLREELARIKARL